MPGLFFNSGIDNGFKKDLKRNRDEFGRFVKGVENKGTVVEQSFGKIKKAIGGVGLSLAAVAASKEIINFSKNLETSLTEVATISQDVTDNFESYKKELIKLSRTEDLAASSADDLSKAYYDVVSAGYDGAEGLSVLEAAARAGTAGFVDASVAADGITTVLNAWGKTAEEAGAVSDVFFKTVEKGKTTFPELGANIAKVAPIAASMGISFEEVSAAIASVTKQGTKTPEALTQLRAAMIGVNKVLGDGWAEAMTFQEALQEVSNKAGGSQNALKELLGTDEAVLAVLALTGKNAQGAASDLDAMTNSIGATSKAAQKVTETSDYQVKLLKNNLLGTFEAIGNQGNKALGKFAGFINDIIGLSLSDEIKSERDEVYRLTGVMQNANTSADDRNLAYEQLKKIQPDILEGINKENVDTAKLTENLQKYNEETINKILLADLDDKAQKLVAKQARIGAERINTQTNAIIAFSKVLGQNASPALNKLSEDALVKLRAGLFLTMDEMELFLETSQSLGDNNLDNLTDNALGAALSFSQYTEQTEKALQNSQQEVVNLEDRKAILKEILGINDEIVKPTDTKVTPTKTTTTNKPIKTPDDLLQSLELQNQLRTNKLIEQYGKEESLQNEFHLKLLENELLYLQEKQRLTKDALEKAKIEEQIITTKISIDDAKSDKELTALLDQYKTFFDTRQKLEEKYNKDIVKLQKKGYKKEALEAEKAKKAALKELDNSFAENEDAYKDWLDRLESELPKVAAEAITKLNNELKDLEYQISISESDETEEAIKKMAIYAAQVEALKKQLKQLQTGETEDGTPTGFSINEIASTASGAFSQLGDDLTDSLSDLAGGFANAFESINNESSSSLTKAAGLIGLIVQLSGMIKKAATERLTEEARNQGEINKGVSDRISAEMAVNEILRERSRIEREYSAFIASNYKENYQAALQDISDSAESTSSALAALQGGAVLTATGTGDKLFGLSEVSEDYSYTIDQILNGINEDNIKLQGGIANAFDPAGLFGGKATTEAMLEAYDNVKSGFNAALTSMGKTSADMANFSAEEWADFYTILEEGGQITDEGTKALVANLRESQQAYTDALETMRDIISSVAGDLGNSLGDALVTSIQEGTSALDEFGKSLNNVLLQMAKTEVNEIFFRGLFDQLQMEMEQSMAGGDLDWQDDILRFYNKLPGAIEGAEDFLKSFDEQMQQLGFEGITGGEDTAVESINDDLSRAGQISQAITEETGSELVGRMGAIMLSNERIANYSEDALDYAIQNLVTLNKIKENTDSLPQIQENTRIIAEKL